MLEKRMERVEQELSEIKSMLMKIEIMLIGEEDIDNEDKKLLEKRLKEALSGNTISLEELLRENNVQS